MSDNEARILAHESVSVSGRSSTENAPHALPSPDDAAILAGGSANDNSLKSFIDALTPRVRHTALAEAIAFLVAVVGFNFLFGDGSRYINVTLHPFWIIVLLIAVQYGPVEGLVTALLSSAFLLVGNLPEQSLSETLYEYILRVSQLPFLWVVTALVLGTIRARQIEERRSLAEGLARAKEVSAAIVGSYKAVKKSKEHLELRLAEERRSVLTMFDIAKSLETLDPTEAEAGVTRLIQVALNPKKFSLFAWKDNALSLHSFHGWAEQDKFIDKFESDSVLVKEGLRKKRILSVVRPEDEKILAGQGMLVGPIYDERTQRLFGILKIEETSFTDMSIRSHETFRVVCAWIARVYANLETHQLALAKKEDFTSELVVLAQNTRKKSISKRRGKR